MERCTTCKHWSRKEVEDAPSRWNETWNNGGHCLSKFIQEDIGEYPPNALMYSYNEGGRFWTGPEFGCVNHEAKA